MNIEPNNIIPIIPAITNKKNKEFFIVADGIGGHLGGKIASKIAVTNISHSLSKYIKSPAWVIQKAIEKANRDIIMSANKSSNLYGMGTTVVLALRYDNKIYIGHVGDSRAYLLRDNMITQITNDHSLVNDLVKIEEISAEEAREHRLRHIITKSLGTKEIIEADITSLSLKGGDYFLLCTDGLTDMLNNEDIKTIIQRNKDPNKICDQLVRSANDRGGHDNITVIVLYFNHSGV